MRAEGGGWRRRYCHSEGALATEESRFQWQRVRICRRLRRLVRNLLNCLILLTATEAAVAQDYAALRERLVADEIEAAGVTNPRVLDAMRSTPRHEFVPASFRQHAYLDAALPIGNKQTISPPFVVAYMTEQLDPQPTDRVLEIGAGSGYQAAVLSPLVDQVFTIEIVKRLGQRAARTLRRLGYENVHVKIGDGYQGWPVHAPFDKIIVTCSPEHVPTPLVEQLAEGGQMIIPVGERYRQNLYRLTKRDGQLQREALQATLFVPMTGTAEESRQRLPDATRPSVFNGNFEQEVPGQQSLPAGWHYLRQARVETSPEAVEGQRFLRLANQTPGKATRALQGLAIDGRKVSKLHAQLRVRSSNVAAGPGAEQLPTAVVTFYDQRRAVIDSQALGPWQGTFPWTLASKQIDVPLAAREAILRLTLQGATGQLDIDDFRLHATAGD